MKVIEVTQSPSLCSMILGAREANRKRPGVVEQLPEVTLVRHNVTLDAVHIARYKALCGFTEAQGVPLIYPQMLSFALMAQYMNSPDCPWPSMGTVHLANSIDQTRSLHAGDSVRVELAAGKLFSHEKGQVYTLDLSIFRDEEQVWSATQSLLRLGVKQPSGEPYTSQVAESSGLSCQAQFKALANIGRRYGAVSGDRNPIHMSALSARVFGFRRAIAHGMWSKARALSCVLPQRALDSVRVAVDFKTPLFLPAQPTLWTARKTCAALFEVRDSKGQKPHLRGQLDY